MVYLRELLSLRCLSALPLIYFSITLLLLLLMETNKSITQFTYVDHYINYKIKQRS